jgi:3-isopropylmalate dehydrogenase
MRLLVLPGDGIGPEITAATLAVARAASERFQLGLEIVEDVVGHASLERSGTTVRPELIDAAKRADGLLLGPTATFDFKDPTRGEINPSMLFRKQLDLYANIRPARTYAGVTARVGEFDLVIARENTEGFYADRNMEQGNAEILVTPDVSISLRRITRVCCARIARTAFELARLRRKHVTAVHKANVLKIGDGLFLDEVRKAARAFPDVTLDEVIVDAMAAHLVRNPKRFDVIVTTNMFGDILSDLAAELSGSLGLGGSLNAGDAYAMAQASHGSAPDIAGRDIANPFSLILSVTQLLAWHGRRRKEQRFVEAAAAIERGVEAAVVAREVTRDIGGTLGTQATGAALAERLRAM